MPLRRGEAVVDVRTRRLWVVPLLVALAACSGGEAEKAWSDSAPPLVPLSATEALKHAAGSSESAGEHVRVRATLLTEQEQALAFLCDSVADSDPEQCSQPRLSLQGAPLDALDLTERRGELGGPVDIVVSIDGDDATYEGAG